MSEKIKCVILEDEILSSQLMEEYITKHENLELIGSYISPVDFIGTKAYTDAQIIFLDIHMPEMSGIDFLKELKPQSEIIMTTANPEYALEGFNLNVVDYLLKPIEYIKFIQATDKALNRLNKASFIPENKEKKDYLFLKVEKKQIKIFTKDIVYIEGAWNYIIIHTTQEQFIVLEKMKDLEDRLPKNNFFRIHKSYIGNTDFLEFIEGNEGFFNGKRLPISRGIKAQLIDKIKEEGL
ncbi:MAG: LytTR family DNA-binding domain-containing protein [Flavobacteriales bacterium]|jgi:DNA-binding LytR/AlgR family response regulator|nr:LytTR family DNA-binding domain-containing protein [Flavobacteriales bacterium]